ncbi:MAG: response regulator [Methanobrevibacter sp.]|uniref:response regulator n=1 Tax=Methanobrevibacter sp. TaxID=66852 RepID=UPI0026DF1B53|nr:response regulator [Methanobrevibacter sp.]MDO5849407.1 response regulator [Methanobrevibacter sp.]
MANKVLIVEDEAITALDLKLSLEELGYEVVDTVDNGHDAVTVAVEERPDVVLMDINLKGDMTGIEAAAQIIKFSIPIIYLTANTDDETFFEANEEGTYGYLTKPYNIIKLKNIIKLTIHRSKIDAQKVNLAHGFIKK